MSPSMFQGYWDDDDDKLCLFLPGVLVASKLHGRELYLQSTVVCSTTTHANLYSSLRHVFSSLALSSPPPTSSLTFITQQRIYPSILPMYVSLRLYSMKLSSVCAK